MVNLFRPLLPLQSSITVFQIQSNPSQTIAFVVGVSLIAAVIIFLNLSKYIKNSAALQGKGGLAVQKNKEHFTVKSSFARTVKHLGLSRKEITELYKILSRGGEDPSEALRNMKIVNEQFKMAYSGINRGFHSENDQERIAELFSIRNALEYFLVSTVKSGQKTPRNFFRKQIVIACNYYNTDFQTQKQNGKITKKLILGKDRMSGSILNLSVGGAAIKTISKLQKAGQYLKVEFNIGISHISVLAKIIRINTVGQSSILNCMFVKATTRSLNAINAFIYNYD